jgi:hypothetical protein
MRALLAWVCLVVVFDAATYVVLRAVVQPEPASADVRLFPTPTLDGCADSALRADEPICTPEPVHNELRADVTVTAMPTCQAVFTPGQACARREVQGSLGATVCKPDEPTLTRVCTTPTH